MDLIYYSDTQIGQLFHVTGAQLTSPNKILFSVNLGVFMSSIGCKSKSGLLMSNVVFFSYPRTKYIGATYQKHNHRYLKYIQMIYIRMLQNSMEKTYPVLVYNPV